MIPEIIEKEHRENIVIVCNGELISRINRVCEQYKVKRGSFVVSMVKAGIDAFELAERIGMVRIVELETSVRGRIKNLFTNLKYIPKEINRC